MPKPKNTGARYAKPDRSRRLGPISKRVKNLSDEEIKTATESDPDAAPFDDADFWATAEVVLPAPKLQITLRLDGDVVRFFKEQGSGYQTRMNAVLRTYMEQRKRKAGTAAQSIR